jgi:hypothetical protein
MSTENVDLNNDLQQTIQSKNEHAKSDQEKNKSDREQKQSKGKSVRSTNGIQTEHKRRKNRAQAQGKRSGS